MFARALPLVVLVGCGPLADADYLGEVLFELSGNVLTSEGLDYAEDDLRVSVFWAVDGFAREEQHVGLTTAFPARYTLSIYAYPPAEAMFASPWSDGSYAVGMPLLYLDHDGDGRWGGDAEPVVGGSPEQVLVYADDQGEERGELEQVRPGFQRMYSEWAASVCRPSPVDQLLQAWPPDSEGTDIVVGAWWEELQDWDCDEDYEEWGALCPAADDLGPWCEEWELEGQPDEPCAELCF